MYQVNVKDMPLQKCALQTARNRVSTRCSYLPLRQLYYTLPVIMYDTNYKIQVTFLQTKRGSFRVTRYYQTLQVRTK